MAPAMAITVAGEDHHREKGKTTAFVIVTACVAACGGLLFGFDNGITGGVIAQPDFAERFFPDTLNGTSSGPFCQFNDHVMHLFVSSLFLAGAFSALVGMWTSRHWGRRPTMILGGINFLIGTILVATAFQSAQLVIGRVILGFGVGFATQATPLYLSEMAPFHLRGALNIMFQLAVTIGILVAQLINYGVRNMDNGWRLSLAMGAVPALILFFGALVLPETPSSLVERGHVDKGREILRRLRGVDNVDAELTDICTAVSAAAAVKNEWTAIFRNRRFTPQLVISVLIPCFQQWTGINAIMFYAPQLFQSLGNGTDAALLNTVVIGCVNVGSTIISIICVDRFGRRGLFLEGGIQMIVTNVIVGVLIQQTTYNQPGNTQMAAATLAMICIYVAGFAWSWGPLGWLVPSEIQPLETRTSGTAVATASNFIMTFVVGQCFLSMLCAMEYGVFFFFAGMVVIMTIFTQLFVPETRNVPIEEIEQERFGKHWFWSRVVLDAPYSGPDSPDARSEDGGDKLAAPVKV